MLVLERILKPGNQPDLARFVDLHMMVGTGGRERTEADFVACAAKRAFR
jgi:hypothetical protein